MDFIILRAFDNYFLANILLTKLRDAGLECYLKDEYTVTIDPLLSNAIGGIKIMTKKSNATKAHALLKQFDNEYRNAVRCPKCGSNDILLMPKQSTENMIAAITSWLFSAYALSAENIYKCSNCGYQSEVLPEAYNELDN